jgi:hypothetical protein
MIYCVTQQGNDAYIIYNEVRELRMSQVGYRICHTFYVQAYLADMLCLKQRWHGIEYEFEFG